MFRSMQHLRLGSLIGLFMLAGCGSSAPPGAPSGGNGGTGGGGGEATGGAGGTSTGGATAVDAAGPASGGSVGGEVDAAAGPDGPAPVTPDGGVASDGSGGPAGPSGPQLGFYEAEAVAPAGPNELIKPAVVSACPDVSPACGSPAGLMTETPCCFSGKEVRQLLRGNGGLVFNKVSAPSDGMYDVTWYYHCGKNDNFGDGNCGGEPNHPAAGCRPHVLTVNGERQPKVFEFHCFPGPWGLIHAVTTPLALKAGDNSIRVVATPGRDAADLDAIAVYPPGKGVQPVAFTH
jgi:hypothetical protein